MFLIIFSILNKLFFNIEWHWFFIIFLLDITIWPTIVLFKELKELKKFN